VIKPEWNSFVFDIGTIPAILLYLDPTVTAARFENTLSHELHHIGFGSSCPTAQAAAETAELAPAVLQTLEWISAFGEGFAMLAAAGGPDVHPHAVSPPDDRDRLEMDRASYNAVLKRVEDFLLEVAGNRLGKEAQDETGTSFYGIQGLWYTVGWKMAVTIKRQLGRAALIEAMCDPQRLLPAYNTAAEAFNRTASTPLALWSTSLVAMLSRVP
jgi:hypothetical protein